MLDVTVPPMRAGPPPGGSTACMCGAGSAGHRKRSGPGWPRRWEGFYGVPFGKFERYCPCGTPDQIAAGLRPYVAAGCRSFNLIPVADTEQAVIEGADAVRAALREERG